MERYTAVFEWPDGEAPRISRNDNWMGGRIVACNFSDALTELRVLSEAVQNYCDNYLRDEIDEPELCHDEHHRKAVEALWSALVPNLNSTTFDVG